MVNLDWRKPIELFVDQQVYMDAVRGYEEVSEFSAVTEVTTFEQRGDELRLEGNILFTAFLESGPGRDADGASAPANPVDQVMHRMPFDLSVPVEHQVAGPLNVSLEVSEATIDVLGPGWLHIRALIKIDGLSGAGGYVAHCGAQEATVGPQARPEPSSPESTATAGHTVAVEPTPGVEPSTAGAGSAEPPADGAPVGDLEPVAMGETRREKSEEERDSLSHAGWKERLAGADRALDGGFSPFRTGRPGAQDEGTALPGTVEEEKESVAEFHFEAARSEQGEVIGYTEQVSREHVTRDHAAQVEPYMAAQGVGQGTGPHAQGAEGAEPSATVGEGGLQASYGAMPESAVNMTAAQWFWKTLNVPRSDVRFTMKFRIVQSEESLEDIAQEYRVSTTELARANRLTQETVDPGSLLYIPAP